MFTPTTHPRCSPQSGNFAPRFVIQLRYMSGLNHVKEKWWNPWLIAAWQPVLQSATPFIESSRGSRFSVQLKKVP